MRLYHVSPIENLESIQELGIEPCHSTGKKRVSWWVEESNLAWALAHVSKVHGVSTGDMVLFYIDTTDYQHLRFVRHPTPHVYLCRSTVHCSAWLFSSEWFDAYMNRYEHPLESV